MENLNMIELSAEREFRASLRGETFQIREVLDQLATGATFAQASKAAGISRITLWRWCRDDPDFARLVETARLVGLKMRTYRLWVNHPFRGKRPPRHTANRGSAYPTPRFRYGVW